MRDFIDAHRGSHGIEPICKVLQVAPSGYRRYAAQRRDPSLRPARAKRDDELVPQIERVWQANMQVYGAEKVWRQLAREGMPMARCTVERLMRRQGLRGVMRGKVVRTTISDNKPPVRWITSIDNSGPRDRTSCGFRISPRCRPGRAGCTWPS